MERKKLSIEDWQKRLAAHFTHDGVVGGRLIPLLKLEDQAGQTFGKNYVGHQKLSDSSQSFALETLRLVTNDKIASASKRNAHFQIIFVDFIMLFRRLRAASILSMNGYMGPGYSLLRDICDKSIYLSALFQGMVTYDDLLGVSKDDPPKGTRDELNNIRRRTRVRLEKGLIEHFYGPKSGLSAEDIEQFVKWNNLFDLETHGSAISSTAAFLPWFKGEGNLHILDTDDATLSTVFMNRFNEAGWMYHRLLVNLQTDDAGFGAEWNERWQVLDESFWQMQKGLADLAKIGDSFIRFIDLKFPFNVATRL